MLLSLATVRGRLLDGTREVRVSGTLKLQVISVDLADSDSTPGPGGRRVLDVRMEKYTRPSPVRKVGVTRKSGPLDVRLRRSSINRVDGLSDHSRCGPVEIRPPFSNVLKVFTPNRSTNGVDLRFTKVDFPIMVHTFVQGVSKGLLVYQEAGPHPRHGPNVFTQTRRFTKFRENLTNPCKFLSFSSVFYT